jgi:SAM-dependent methyltransferase
LRSLARLRRSWDRFGRSDPFWAVLTDPGKRGGRWSPEEFFESGALEVAAVLRRADALGLHVARSRALDFGCGAGRLTQALAMHFDSADGVDIAPSMVRLARRLNRRGERCRYHLNDATHLGRFADGSFSFVYSVLVLQHMDPALARGYVREFLRVLAPGGLAVFQVPSHRTPEPPPPDATRTAPSGALPRPAFVARIRPGQDAIEGRAASILTLRITLENRSDVSWPCLADPDDRFRLQLGNHWLRADGSLHQLDDGRAPLPYDLAPGGKAEALLAVTLPPEPGDYWLELDLVQEDVAWFEARGSPTARIPCRVTGPPPTSPIEPRPTGRKAERPPEPPPPDVLFRDRHPRLHRALRATGLRAAYWFWRRRIDDLKRRRDRIRDRPRPRRRTEPVMEMNCIREQEIQALVAEGGGRVVDLERERVAGGFLSVRYWVVGGGHWRTTR